MTPKIKNKIELEINKRYPVWRGCGVTYHTGGYKEVAAGGFEQGAKYGYNLAKKELKLKNKTINK